MNSQNQHSTSLSIRWRVILPVFILFVALAAWAAYTTVSTPSATAGPQSGAGQQFVALIAAAGAGLAVVVLFFVVTVIVVRVNRVRKITEDLASGSHTARTGLTGGDEIGRLGAALDQYADYVQERQDELRTQLRRRRRELTHLLAVVEAIPDGVIVQDLDGRVMLMNDVARALLGSQRVFRSAGLHELTAIVTDQLGAALAPGLYALGNPQRVDLDGRMLTAQAAAVMSNASETRLGTVIVLREITEEVRRDRARAAMLDRLERDVQNPLMDLAQRTQQSGYVTDLMMKDFARELIRRAVALQKVIVEMRDLHDTDAVAVQRGQSPILLETLLWAVANEWRQVAQAQGLEMHITIEQKGLYVLGDERRLRWALGNIVDNAIKYTPHGGALTVEIKGEAEDMAHLRVRDNGTGIRTDDLPHIFTRFFRGTPTTADGQVIRVPGMGQGLYIARQIIEAHGGSIRVKSREGVGTAVYLSLPLTAPEGLQLPRFSSEDIDSETIILNRDRRRKHDES